MGGVLVDEGPGDVEVVGRDPTHAGVGHTGVAGHDPRSADEGVARRQRAGVPVGAVRLAVAVGVAIGLVVAGEVGHDEVVQRFTGSNGDHVSEIHRGAALNGRTGSGIGLLAVGHHFDRHFALGRGWRRVDESRAGNSPYDTGDDCDDGRADG